MLAFVVGALLPLLTISFSPGVDAGLGHGRQRRRGPGPDRAGSSARMGRSPVTRAVVRNVAGGLLAMGVTYLIGVVAGVSLG